MTLPSPSELQAISERYERSCTATSHTDLVAPLADIPTLLEAVKELTEAHERWRVESAKVYNLVDTERDDARAQLAAMTARCERLEGVIEQFIDSFKQVWMTSAMERAFNAGLEALRDEPTGGGT